MTTQQVETATVIGTIDSGGAGNASVIVTARDVSSSPVTLSVAVTNSWTASQVADAIRDALAYNSAIAAQFVVSGTGADVVLTRHVAVANDSTLNIAIDNGTCTGLTAAPTSTNTTAGDGITNGYASLADLKAADVLNFSNTDHDAVLEREIEAASRAIDEFCGRHFYQEAATRYYTPEHTDGIDIDDIYSASITLLTDTNGDGTFDYTWTATDYNLYPYNPRTGRPYTRIETTPVTSVGFPRVRKGVKLTASFGWSAVPAPINQACVMLAQRLHKRNATILGQAAASAVGTISLKIPGIDPDVRMLLLDYRRSMT